MLSESRSKIGILFFAVARCVGNQFVQTGEIACTVNERMGVARSEGADGRDLFGESRREGMRRHVDFYGGRRLTKARHARDKGIDLLRTRDGVESLTADRDGAISLGAAVYPVGVRGRAPGVTRRGENFE